MLTIHNDSLGDVSLSARVPSPMRILAALAEQIGGHTWIDETANGTRRLLLRFLHPAHSSLAREPSDDELGWGDREISLTGPIYGAREPSDGTFDP